MSFSVAGLTPLKIPESAIVKSDRPMVEFVKPTSEEEVAARLAADEKKKPDRVWGEIYVGGKLMAKVYEKGGYAYYGNAQLNIDTSVPPSDMAKQLMKQIGGHLQLVQGGRREFYL